MKLFESTHFYLIAYDIKSNKRRQRIEKILLGHGQKVQWSVFECQLDQAHIKDLRNRLLEILNVNEDSLHVYSLCEKDRKGRRALGVNAIYSEEHFLII